MGKYLIIFTLFLASCAETQNEDVSKDIDKSGSIETTITTTRLTNYTLLTITQRVWVNNSCTKTIHRVDTIQNLGIDPQYVEGSQGQDTLILLPKEYQHFITVQ